MGLERKGRFERALGYRNQSWIFIGRTDVEAETLILWPLDAKSRSPWCWERLKVGGEGDDRGWDGWMASPTQWTWVWVNSRSWWWTGRPGVLKSMGSQRVGHDWATELNWTEYLRNKTSNTNDLGTTISPLKANFGNSMNTIRLQWKNHSSSIQNIFIKLPIWVIKRASDDMVIALVKYMVPLPTSFYVAGIRTLSMVSLVKHYVKT